jgi:hypothetical protein
MSQPTDEDFLSEYESEDTWSMRHGITRRTAQRYREDGLPYMFWGGRIWIHKQGGAEYIASRVRRRNQRKSKTAA